MESDADINVANLHEGNTPLILACQSAMANTAYLLVERDADIRARNLEGKTALSEATKVALRCRPRPLVCCPVLTSGVFCDAERAPGGGEYRAPALGHRGQGLSTSSSNSRTDLESTGLDKVAHVLRKFLRR